MRSLKAFINSFESKICIQHGLFVLLVWFLWWFICLFVLMLSTKR